jgi:hypothetical protein
VFSIHVDYIDNDVLTWHMSLLHASVVSSSAEEAVERKTNFVRHRKNKICSCLHVFVVGNVDVVMNNGFGKGERSKFALSDRNCISR